MAFFAVGLGCLGVSALFHLSDPTVRNAGCSSSLSFVSAVIQGRLEGQCVVVSADRIVVEDVRLYGASGSELAHAGKVEVSLRLSDLTKGRLVLNRAALSAVVVSLNRTPEGELEILDALRSTSNQSDEGSGLRPDLRIESVLVDEGRLIGLPGDFTVERLSVAARVALVGERLSITVKSVRAAAIQDEREIARLDSLTGQLELLEPDAESAVTARLSGGESRVDLEGAFRWGESTIAGYRGLARVDVRPTLGRRLGLPTVEDFVRGSVAGTVQLRGDLNAASLHAELETDGGSCSIEATTRLPDASGNLRLSTRELDLRQVLNAPGVGVVAGNLSIEVASPSRANVRRTKIELLGFHYDDYPFPSVTATVDVGPESVALVDVAIPEWTRGGGWLRTHGRAHFDGPVDVDVDARFPQLARDPAIRRIAPNVRAGVELDLQVDMDLSAVPSISVGGDFRAERARLPGNVTIDRFRASGSVRGALPNPEVAVAVHARGIDAFASRVERADLEINGGPDRYRLSGHAEIASRSGKTPKAFGTDFDFSVHYQPASKTAAVAGSATAHGWLDVPVEMSVDRLAIDPSDGVSVDSLTLQAGDGRAVVAGAYRFDSESAFDATWSEIDVGAWAAAFGVEERAAGVSTGSASIRGSMNAPHVRADIGVQDGWLGHLLFDRVEVHGELNVPGRRAALATHTDLTGGGRVQLDAHGALSQAKRMEKAVLGATWQADLAIDDLSLASLQVALPEEAPELAGTVFARAGFTGTIDQPETAVQWSGRRLVAGGRPLPDIDGWIEIADRSLTTHVELADGEVPMLEVDGSAHVGLRDLLEGHLAEGGWLAHPWEVAIRVEEQRLDRLPPPARVPLPLLVEATIRARGGDGEPTRATVESRGELIRAPNSLGACDWDHPIRFRSVVSLARGRTEATASAITDELEVAHATATAVTPVDHWLAHGWPTSVPEVAAALGIDNLPTHSLPTVCEEHGRVDGDIVVTGLFGAQPSLSSELRVSELSLGDDRGSAAFLVGAEIDGGMATVHATLHHDDREAMRLEGSAPTTWDRAHQLPVFDIERARADARFIDAPVGPLLGFVPGVAGGSGVIAGEVRARGQWHQGRRDFDVEGQLAFRKVGFTVESPVFRMADLDGNVSVHRERLRLSGIRFRDRGGEVAIDGDVTFDREFAPKTLTVDAVADDYPVRVDGVVLATVAGRAHMSGRLDDQRRRIDLTLRDMAIEVPSDLGRTLQSLEDHPSVYYETDPQYRVAHLPRDAELVADARPSFRSSFYPLRVSVDATQAFWIRREDFALQLTSSLAVRLTQRGPRIRGAVDVRRGYIVLPGVGKRFDLRRSQLRFDGSRVIDPILDIEAVHDIGGGETIHMYVTGRISEPDVRFASSDGDLTNVEVIQAALGGSGSSTESAEEQMVGAIVGMASGLLSDLTRREYGDLIPILRIDADVTSTRQSGGIRAGIQADRLIPSFLEDTITGAYLEGFVSASHEADGGTEATVSGSGGFLLELYFPHDLSATGTYQEPSNWSLDLTWEP